MRRVVTGQDGDGRSVFVSDEEVPAVEVSLVPTAVWYRLWGDDGLPRLPSNGTPPEQPTFFPPPGGHRVVVFTIPAQGVTVPTDLDLTSALAEFQEKLPGMADWIEVDHPGMHTTDTVDFDLVLSGECWLELDDGHEVQLRTGDGVIQNGTRHAWHNRTDQDCLMLAVLIGADRRK